MRDFEPWMDRFFRSYYARRPVNATFIGVHELDDRLPDFSENGVGDTIAEMESLLRESSRIRPGSLGPMERLDLQLARGFLRIQLWEYGSRHFHQGNPSLYTGEAIFGVMSLFLSDFAPIPRRVDAAVARLEAVPALLAQGRARVREAPADWTARARTECVGARLFLEEGLERLVADAGIPAEPLRAAARKAGAAFEDFARHLETGVRDAVPGTEAAGEEALSLYLREGHFLEESPEEIDAYARAALEETKARLRTRARALGESDPDRLLAGLEDLHPEPGRYYDRYRELWDGARQVAREHDLLTWPDFPIRYLPRPAWSRAAAPHLYFLFYRSPAAFNRPPVHPYLVTPIEADVPGEERTRLLRANNDSVIKLNHVIHHGSIGHHVQNWHAFRSDSRIGRVAAVDCASRIAMFCGGTMAEGWACYATDLMDEVGFLTPLESLAELRARIRMCVRAIVDVNLHRGHLSLDEAAALYVQDAGMSATAARSEAVKNSMFPGAALMYLAGTDAIHRLRATLSTRMGSSFRLRTFHDRFLSFGSVPVSLIAREMVREMEEP